ncbi:hypothetical protein QVD17_00618 [Tagetes erecta]|uniref:Uncharacterized protein n=1 Tax=Tagetes erecta TaxID=13708 RepID=A0AAD8L3J0_TARER|nr:hypothetical protein QVD17_00618 [Tagetes erecta]
MTLVKTCLRWNEDAFENAWFKSTGTTDFDVKCAKHTGLELLHSCVLSDSLGFAGSLLITLTVSLNG